MAVVKLTKKLIDSLDFVNSGQAFYWDSELRNLGVRVTKGSKAFVVQKKAKGKAKREVIERCDLLTLEEARQRCRELLVVFDKTGRFSASVPSGTNPTLGDYLDRFMRDKKESTKQFYHWMSKHVKPHPIGKLPIKEIKHSHVQDHLFLLRGKISEDLRDKVYITLNAVFNSALQEELIEDNPLWKVRRQKPQKASDIKIIEGEDYKKFLGTALHDDLAALWISAIICGCRISELLGLTWKFVSLETENPHIRIHQQLIEAKTAGEPYLSTDLKTKESHRTIPLNKMLVELFDVHQKHFSTKNSLGLVFTTNNGQPIRLSNLRRRNWKNLLGKAGVPYHRIHSLRHTAASHWLVQGYSPHKVAGMLGHSSTRMVNEIYGHIMAGRRKAMMEQSDAYLKTLILSYDPKA